MEESRQGQDNSSYTVRFTEWRCTIENKWDMVSLRDRVEFKLPHYYYTIGSLRVDHLSYWLSKFEGCNKGSYKRQRQECPDLSEDKTIRDQGASSSNSFPYWDIDLDQLLAIMKPNKSLVTQLIHLIQLDPTPIKLSTHSNF